MRLRRKRRPRYAMEPNARTPTASDDRVWDIVVAGAGAGGGTAGFNLARLGRSVLFLERGTYSGSSGRSSASRVGTSAALLESGWWPHPVQRQGAAHEPFAVRIGCGVGGSTALFAMVMDRFRPIDFEPFRYALRDLPTSLPDAWPITYDDLEPYYRDAEILYRVRGSHDPLTSSTSSLLDPPKPSAPEDTIHAAMQTHGLHPYRLHYAWEHRDDCENGCVLRVCSKSCRNDTGRVCVMPALQRYGAKLLTNCHVVRLNTTRRAVTSATCILDGKVMTIRGRVFILGLGALLTPPLLLRSANETFPDGLGNGSGMVGRNLMFHVSDHLRVELPDFRGSVNVLLQHGISLNDFYFFRDRKLGTIQAHAFDFGLPARYFGSEDSSGGIVFHTVVEDFPYAANRVMPAPGSSDGVRWEYAYPEELRMRSQMLVRAFSKALRSTFDVKVLPAGGSLNGTHACGTCRFGSDPRTSVLDADNRMHELDNLYVVDASFFPSSGGMNPSLTIAANALRVSNLVAQR